MALQKQITDDRGVMTEYHKIDNIQICKDSKNGGAQNYAVYATVSSYTSADVRLTGADLYATVQDYCFNFTLEMIEQGPIYKVVYDVLKKTEKFKDATDV